MNTEPRLNAYRIATEAVGEDSQHATRTIIDSHTDYTEHSAKGTSDDRRAVHDMFLKNKGRYFSRVLAVFGRHLGDTDKIRIE